MSAKKGRGGVAALYFHLFFMASNFGERGTVWNLQKTGVKNFPPAASFMELWSYAKICSWRHVASRDELENVCNISLKWPHPVLQVQERIIQDHRHFWLETNYFFFDNSCIFLPTFSVISVGTRKSASEPFQNQWNRKLKRERRETSATTAKKRSHIQEPTILIASHWWFDWIIPKWLQSPKLSLSGHGPVSDPRSNAKDLTPQKAAPRARPHFGCHHMRWNQIFLLTS